MIIVIYSIHNTRIMETLKNKLKLNICRLDPQISAKKLSEIPQTFYTYYALAIMHNDL